MWGVHSTNKKKKRLGVGVGWRFLGLNQFLLGSKLTPCSMFCASGESSVGFLNQLKFRQLRYHYLEWPHFSLVVRSTMGSDQFCSSIYVRIFLVQKLSYRYRWRCIFGGAFYPLYSYRFEDTKRTFRNN